MVFVAFCSGSETLAKDAWNESASEDPDKSASVVVAEAQGLASCDQGFDHASCLSVGLENQIDHDSIEVLHRHWNMVP